jgi:hypothetical protein
MKSIVVIPCHEDQIERTDSLKEGGNDACETENTKSLPALNPNKKSRYCYCEDVS